MNKPDDEALAVLRSRVEELEGETEQLRGYLQANYRTGIALEARVEELEGALRKIANANISEYAAQIARSALSEGSGSSRELAPPDESGDACGATERAEG